MPAWHDGDRGVHRLPLPTPFPVGPVNAYLIDDDPLTLVDAGPNSGTTYAALEIALRRCGRRVEDIGLVLLTHQHVDHIGLAGLVAARGRADVAALTPLKPWLRDYEDSMRGQQRYADMIMKDHGVPRDIRLVIKASSRRMQGWGARVDVTAPFHDGDELTFRDRTLTVRHRPGHSPSDTVFCDYDNGLMISGDHLLPHISSNPLITEPLEPTSKRPQTLATYIASMRASQREPTSTVLPGHGDPFGNHSELIGTRLALHDQRCERIYDLISQGPRTAHQLARAMWDEVAVTQAYLTISEVVGHVDLLINAGRVVAGEDAAGGVQFRTS
jgi:glyoxylase-like metal-dependent hydrolase (beta-lactamase superfamily II)